jgi:hypothetical protein
LTVTTTDRDARDVFGAALYDGVEPVGVASGARSASLGNLEAGRLHPCAVVALCRPTGTCTGDPRRLTPRIFAWDTTPSRHPTAVDMRAPREMR